MKKRLLRWKQIIPLEILVGILLLVGVFIISANADISAAEQRLSQTVKYIKEQCNASQLRDLASESKSLLRVTESIEQIRWRLEYGDESMETQEETEKTLKDCAQDSYLSGLLLLDAEGKVLAQYDRAGFTAEELLSRIDTDALMDVADFMEKTYAVRINNEDESHIDLAAVGCIGQKQIIVGYFYTEAEYAQIFNNPIRTLVSGYEPEKNGTIVISSGSRIIASNNADLIGKDTNDIRILKRMMERGSGTKLTHASSDGTIFKHDFGLMDKGQNYYIYAYMTERAVFEITPKNLLYTVFLYALLLIIVHMLWWRTKQTYQKKQIREQQKYTEMLQLKNEQLREAVKQAEKANAAKSNFLSRMSHDIRTPLNGIIGLLKIDETHFDDIALIQKNHGKIAISANHLLALINDVLQMSKLEDGTVVLSHEALDLPSLSKEILTIVGEHALEAGISLEFDTESSSLPYSYVYGSPLHLRQIFLNIYSNCIKYNKPNGRIYSSVQCLGTEQDTVTYRWRISDTGVGMSESFLKHIFDPFTQERNDARSVYQGTGLGMSIVKALLEQMNGTIDVSSKEDEGSTFIITIPFTIAEKPENIETENTEIADIQGLNLLLAEDNELNAEIAQTLLEDEGAKIFVVTDGQQAVEMFEKTPPETFDAILMDVMMPVMDGLTATRAIRALDRADAKTIPIIAMTANAFKEDEEKCLAAGMNAHLAKPLDITKVISVIAQYSHKKA